ncbi:ABC transporter ATP-binding protein [Sporosarcina sp. Sa2YVA2]|uniref:ABC transporter ATP-binding protein n=1 Tax=Sporosarcina quadrami TaxID=2762234 RepID=A0ABR8UD95_9BACL|nr:ABC transporter ATP-binding protein [Sporosarcina quadrami]MBD7986004.1 ABC transporter ATP-binding protein [Sporosarcina quadrami]
MVTEITCSSLTKSYVGDGVKTNAIKNIDIIFRKEEFSAIVGSSGSGKSTLLSLLGTLDKPSEGTVLYDSHDIMKKRKKEIADFRFNEIGFIFQQFHLLPTLTALENVMTPLFSRKVPYNKQKRATEVLAQVGLEDKLNSLPSQLSGGQQQRVAIARAIVHKPSWLLADEPTGNLDTETGELVLELLRNLKQEVGCGLIIVTHDPELAAKADRVITMKDGLIVSDKIGAGV